MLQKAQEYDFVLLECLVFEVTVLHGQQVYPRWPSPEKTFSLIGEFLHNAGIAHAWGCGRARPKLTFCMRMLHFVEPVEYGIMRRLQQINGVLSIKSTSHKAAD